MNVINTILEGGPEDQHSWFPGYSWTICKCISCLDQVVCTLALPTMFLHLIVMSPMIMTKNEKVLSGLLHA